MLENANTLKTEREATETKKHPPLSGLEILAALHIISATAPYLQYRVLAHRANSSLSYLINDLPDGSYSTRASLELFRDLVNLTDAAFRGWITYYNLGVTATTKMVSQMQNGYAMEERNPQAF